MADGLGEVLDRAGDERFLAKSQGFALELADGACDPDQVLYRALMDGAGIRIEPEALQRAL